MVTITPGEVKVNKGEHAELTCLATGVDASNFKYQWFLNKVLITSQNTSTLVINAVTEDNTGDYTCSVSDSYGGIGKSKIARLILGTQMYIINKLFLVGYSSTR